MDKVCVEENRGSKPLSSAEAQQLLAAALNDIAGRVAPYCWKLTGTDPDSLCNLLDIDGDAMVDMLCMCNILGQGDCRLSMRNFENFAMLLQKPNIDWQTYRPSGASARTPFIRIGNPETDEANVSLKGSDQYNGSHGLFLLSQFVTSREEQIRASWLASSMML